VLLANYYYDYRGLRTRKVTTAAAPQGVQVVRFVYDEAGHLIEELSTSGAPIRTYVWRDDTPVAQIDHVPTRHIRYFATDHLNTPRAAMDEAGKVIWRWESDAFGSTPANEDPDGEGVKTTVNLRFPGQYYDQETGLHYNWQRYYHPGSGQYTQPDRIGLRGGSFSTYTYVRSNPLKYRDTTGLDVRVENTAQVGGLHQHISVDTPNGPYAISFGLPSRDSPQQGSSNASGVNPGRGVQGSGIVYEDPDPATEVSRTLHTTAGEDARIAEYLHNQVNNTGPYNAGTNSCRTFSNNQFDNILRLFDEGYFDR